MKLDSRDLRGVYQADIRDKIPQTRKFCPSPKEILRLFRGEKSEKKKENLVDHLTNCFYCSQEFEFIVEALRYEKEMNKIAEELIAKKKKEPVSRLTTSNSFSSRIKWGYATLIASFILVFSLATILFFSIKFENSKYRGSSLNQIELIKPRKKMLAESTPAFEWKTIQGADYYILEIFDETLLPVWTSNKIKTNSIILSSEISSRLESNRSYFWMITAVLQSGTKKESILKEFKLKRK